MSGVIVVKSANPTNLSSYERTGRLREGLKAARILQDALVVSGEGGMCIVLGNNDGLYSLRLASITMIMKRNATLDQIVAVVDALHSPKQQIIVDLMTLVHPGDDICVAMACGAPATDVVAAVRAHHGPNQRVIIEIMGKFSTDRWNDVAGFVEHWATPE